MYLSFYGLQKQPFHVTPDPEFLYFSPSHKDAMSAITHGIEEKKGFIAITGNVGAGKTTILRSYLDATKSEPLKIVYVFNARLTFEELLKTIYRELGRRVEGNSVMGMVNRLYEFLIEESRQGNTVVLIIDEAQNMPVDTLENLRMMSNCETSKEKLIQIVLVGQPEFKKALDTDGLRQLRQRLAVHATIRPLSRAESLEYLRFRLRHAGTDPASVFTTPALKKIVRKSKGIPRVLNVLCDNALITGFGRQQKPVTKKIAKEIIRMFKGRPHYLQTGLRLAAALAPVLSAFGITSFLRKDRVPPIKNASLYKEPTVVEAVAAVDEVSAAARTPS
ncbi:MAG: AAA family ATPase [Syntrophorhabdales bacterium]|jgi:general secretion pathway protein A